jgi:hypothetical protein
MKSQKKPIILLLLLFIFFLSVEDLLSNTVSTEKKDEVSEIKAVFSYMSLILRENSILIYDYFDDFYQFQLGKTFEKHGDFNNAIGSYSKALNSRSFFLKKLALNSIDSLLSRKTPISKKISTSFFNEIFFPTLKIPLSAILLIFFILIIFVIAKKFIKKNKNITFKIDSFVDSTANNLTASFLVIFMNIYDQKCYESNSKSWGKTSTSMPMSTESQNSETLDLISSIFPGAPERAINVFKKYFFKVDYSISGCMQSVNNEINILLKLKRGNDLIKYWDINCSVGTLYNNERDLAYEVLSYLWSLNYENV